MRKVWAVAVNTIRQTLRMKVVLFLIVVLLLTIVAMGLRITGDNTLKGRLQTFISYSLSLTSFVLCLFTVLTAAYTLTIDLKDRYVYTVLTKPLARYQLIFGKFLGVVILNIALLIFFACVIYGVTLYMPKYYKATLQEMQEADNEFFTARAAIEPQQPDVSQDVDSEFARLRRLGQLPEGIEQNRIALSNYMAELEKRIKLRRRAAPVGNELMFYFNNLHALERRQTFFIRFKYDVALNPEDLSVYSRWTIGDDRQIRFGGPVITPIYSVDRKDIIRTPHEIEVPADCIADDGYVAVGFLNLPLNETVVIFPPEDGMELLYKADSFTANYFRSVTLILLRLIFLAALGFAAGSFLSFPVAVLFTLSVFLTANMSGFILDSFEYVSKAFAGIYQYFFRWLILLLPQFDKFNTSTYLVPGRLLSWIQLGKLALIMFGIQTLILVILALFFFSRRELAKVIV